MTYAKINEVLDRYEELLNQDDIIKRMSGGHGEADDRMHLTQMIPQMREFNRMGGQREKLMRWLGFMQGAFWAYDIYAIDELKHHNMSHK